MVSVLDQCLFTGTNFLVSVVAGRFGGRDTLGQYALAFSVLVIAIGIQRALLMSPMVIVRGRMDDRELSAMRFAIAAATLALGTIGAAGAAGVIAATGVLPTMWIVVFAMAFPAALLRDFTRRLAIYQFNLRSAVIMDGLIAAVQIVTLVGLIQMDWVRADVLLGSAAVVWGGVCGGALWFTRGQYRFAPASIVPVIKQLWPIGRWVSLSAVVATTQAFVMPWVMAAAATIQLAGVYAACWTIVQMVSPLIEGLGNLIGPSLADQAERKSWSGLRRSVMGNTVLFGVIMTLLLIGLWCFGRPILLALYGDDFAGFTGVLLVLALAATANNLGIPVLKALVQLGHAKMNFLISIVSLSVSLSLSWWLLRAVGPSGAAWGLVVGNAGGTAVRWWQFLSLEPVVLSAAESSYGHPATSAGS